MPGREPMDDQVADPILIVPYDPAWPDMFDAEAVRLRAALGALALRIDHVGSTAVPGLAAKPVIDMQVSVKPLILSPKKGGGDAGEAAAEPAYGRWRAVLESLGYHYFHDPDFEDYPFFCRPPDWPHAYHIHVCEAGGLLERRHLAFRDALRADPALAGRYEALKCDLARRHSAATHETRNAYADAKSDFIAAVWKTVFGENR